MEQFKEIVEAVRSAGKRAWELQREVVIEYKHDGSILTQADLEINKTLSEAIKRSFPDANIVAEEQETAFRSGRDWTFTIDPIDGTDSYSQGMPGWCVAVGIHDHELTPVGGIVSAPRWGTDPEEGLFIYRLPSGETDIRGAQIEKKESPRDATSLMIGSKVHRKYGFSSFPGKVRSVGSSILHAIAPLIHPDVMGAVLTPMFIWDISAAHGIVRPHGIEVVYPEGNEVSYRTMVHRQRAAHCIVIADSHGVKQILSHFT